MFLNSEKKYFAFTSEFILTKCDALYKIESKLFKFFSSLLYYRIFYLAQTKGVMQGKLIAVVYTLRTHWNQFSLGGICKQD